MVKINGGGSSVPKESTSGQPTDSTKKTDFNIHDKAKQDRGQTELMHKELTSFEEQLNALALELKQHPENKSAQKEYKEVAAKIDELNKQIYGN